MTQLPRRRRAVAATGATALLASLLVPAAATADDDPTTLDDLIISEYVEGSSFNKALEIYNGTSATIDLADYAVQQFSNGSVDAGLTFALQGALAPGDVYVLAHSSADPAILAQADLTSGAGLFNGDDALTLARAGVVVDAIGQVGVDPGSQWGDGLVSTADNTLRRKADVCAGDTNPGDVFDPVLEWDGFDTDTFDGLGAHTTSCGAGGPGGPGDPVDVCEVISTPIGEVQGSGEATPLAGQNVTVRGTVVGEYLDAFDGFFVQDSGDRDRATSDGIFVHAPGGADVVVGDVVALHGTAGEFRGQTQLTGVTTEVCSSDGEIPDPVEVSLPTDDHEAYESMLVTYPDDLFILEYFNYDRFGEMVLGVGEASLRQFQPTAVFEPGSSDAVALAEHNTTHRITLDDGLNVQNPTVLRHPNGEAFTLANRFRGGDVVTDVTGVLDYRFSQWRVQPTAPADHTVTNPRPDAPELGGTTTVAAFNVLNYFTTLGSRGADTPEEFERQEAKIVAAINELDTDVVGLIEIENNGVALTTLVEALNEGAGETRWAEVETGVVGSDEITTAFIYQVGEVAPVGNFALLHSGVDERFADEYNRPALAQTFEDLATGGSVTVINNHLKSKGSSCEADGDPTDPDGQGNCNGVRTAAAEALAEWAAGDPTMTGTENVLIIGDLNSYDKEDPIDVLREAGYTDLLLQEEGEYAYTYVFDGMLGYLDYALANEALAGHVVDATTWAINADEPDVLDYDLDFKKAPQSEFFEKNPYRSSDHDPVIVGLDLTVEDPDTVAPELEVVVEPPHVWPPNNKWRNLTTVVMATDDSGQEPTVSLVGAEADGGKIKVVDDHKFRVQAVLGATYTLTYEATDAAGNSTTTSVTVEVAKPGKGNGLDKDRPGKPGKPGKPGGR
ncbi:ExeM/NucH family extracellular endonuclease [Ornithinimicrobium sp. W1665]|uniref:ExeM/NucH family extracellular endonuclease n=1 Tax=Ornithinimicrobium sp. W1665 TaxID=3416666 RepID=UPI003CEE4AB1